MVDKIKPVKLISGLLSADKTILSKAKQTLEKHYGPIDLESPVIAFNFTDYYDDELGKGIMRQYISFEKLIRPEYISKIKRHTIRLEKRFMVGENRKVNIDPGYVSLDKLVLATTKDATYRIYLGRGIYPALWKNFDACCGWVTNLVRAVVGLNPKLRAKGGIYAQSTLFFQKGTFHPWQWTYPDYKTDMAIEFFNKVREVYKKAIK